MSFRRAAFCSAIALLLASATPATAGLTIQLNPNPTLSGNAAALGAFDRAAGRWEALFGDDILVTIDAGLAPLGAGVIGSASSVQLGADGAAGFDLIRDAMAADAADEASNAVAAFLPNGATFSFSTPAGVTILGLESTKANLKALGFTGLDAIFGAADAAITFSSNFGFDFDNSDGVTPGQIDFETVAVHEIGHALGFISAVDDIDAGLTAVRATALDLFRFNLAAAPSNVAEFSTFTREFRPGQEALFDDLANEFRFSTGSFNGDGRQASHWKDSPFGSMPIGVMDPTYDSAFNGGVTPISAADLRAFDLIGWDVIQPAAVPEPGSLLLCLFAAGPAAFVLRRRMRQTVTTDGTLVA